VSGEDFYVGWQDEAPPALARAARRAGLLAVALGALVGTAVAVSQSVLPDGTFEYGRVPRWTGRLVAEPLPLLVGATRDDDPGTPPTTLVLVGTGKHGVSGDVRALDGSIATLRGSRVARDGDVSMLEVHSVEESSAAPRTAPATSSLGPATLVGELVDTKCWLGVMRPATGKVHRACAVRCLSGGVPPGLLVHLGDGDVVTVLLSGSEGRPLDVPARLAARVLRVEGELEVREDVLVLRVARWSLVT
jgi:hypothetical protein